MNNNGKFECHVTVDKLDFQPVIEIHKDIAAEQGWKTSAIDGDPVLGQKVFFYFTCFSTDLVEIVTKMNKLAEALGAAVVRKKIESIIYDSREHDGH